MIGDTMTIGTDLGYFESTVKDLKEATLCYLLSKDGSKVLIAMKKRGFGVGRLNGVGGKLKSDETVEDAMVRETEEEIGVKLTSYQKRAKIKFFFAGEGHDDWNMVCHVFTADNWIGDPSESEEMKPEWCDIDKLPFDKMWPDDKYWLNSIITGKNVEASFLFDENDKIIDHKVTEVEELSP